jgi:hypothetical protein
MADIIKRMKFIARYAAWSLRTVIMFGPESVWMHPTADELARMKRDA